MNFSAHRVQIRIEGFRIDKLLNRAMKEGLDIRGIQFLSQLEAICWLTPEDLKQLRKLTKALYKISEVEHCGPEYKLIRFIKDPIRIAGIFIILFLVVGQSLFVKTIEVEGYRAIPETELRKALEETGIKEGSYRPGIDWNKAEEHIYESFPQITWLSIVYDGRKVFLTVAEGKGLSDQAKEEEIPEDVLQLTVHREKYYGNIVASCAGYIESISTYRGLELVEVGDYVEKGQILVSGYIPTKPTVFEEGYPEFYLVKAQSTIVAKVPYRLTFNQERYVPAETAVLYEQDKKDGAYEKDEREKGEIVLNKREKSEKEVKEKVEQQIRQWIKENLPEKAEILNKSLNFSYKENIIEVGVTLEVRQQIGEEQEILIGQESTDTSGN